MFDDWRESFMRRLSHLDDEAIAPAVVMPTSSRGSPCEVPESGPQRRFAALPQCFRSRR
jgi:hypothetical protein